MRGERIMNPIYRIGQERFYNRYPNYPKMREDYNGIGLVCDSDLIDKLEIEHSQKSHNVLNQ